MVQNLENLTMLHAHEEELRAKSLAVVTASEPLAAHMHAAQAAMDHLHALLASHTEVGTDEHALQLICIRLFNVGATTLKLGLAGYYQASFQTLRDAFEVVNLVDLFRIDSTAISRWRTADDHAHQKEFKPITVRLTLEKHLDFKEQKRNPIYKTYSNFATHATYKSFNLLMSGSLVQLGPFFDEPKLKAVLEDLGAHLSHATLGVSMLFDKGSTLELLIAKSEFLASLQAYHQKYISQAGAPSS
jgi:hypothetical protein